MGRHLKRILVVGVARAYLMTVIGVCAFAVRQVAAADAADRAEALPEAGETRTFADMEFVWIPPGTFQMGSPSSEKDRQDDEGTVHTVRVSKGFWLGKYEVTKEDWKSVMGTEPWSWKNRVIEDPRSPAVFVSWDDAREFIQQLNRRGEGTFRLPTEAEWEYACRAGTGTRFFYGDDPGYSQLGDYAWYYGNTMPGAEEYAQPLAQKRPILSGSYLGPDNIFMYAHRVGQKKPNRWGLYDMHGNVWEWCADRWGEDYYSKSAAADPRGPGGGQWRVLRGGSWSVAGHCLRSARRARNGPWLRSSQVGFRVARNSP